MAKKTAATDGDKPTPVGRAKKAVAGAAGAVADALATAAEVVQEKVVRPAAEAVGATEPKAREAVRKAGKAAPKGKSAAGKVMSKNVSAGPVKAGKSKGPSGAKRPAAADLRKKMTQPPRRRAR